MPKTKLKDYAIYDSRYSTDPDRAVCFEICDTLKEARESKDDYGDGSVIVEHILEQTGERQFNIISSKIVS